MNAQKSNPSNKKLTFNKFTQFKYFNVVAFVVLFSAIGTSIIIYSQAAPKGKNSYANTVASATISLIPASQRIKSGSTFTVQVWEDSQDKPVNAVQVNLSYSQSAFEFVNIDSSGSRFDVAAQASEANGNISIARGYIGSLTGNQLVASITFKAKASSGRSSINITDGTILSSADTNTDILQSTVGGTYSFSR